MTDKFEIKVDGMRELQKFLQKELPKKLQRTSTLAGMKKSVAPMVLDAAYRAPMRSGALRESMKSKAVRKRDENFAAMTWGPVTNVPTSQAAWAATYLEGDGDWVMGKSKIPAGPYYGMFHEYGYYNKLLDKHIPGKYFMLKAFDANIYQYTASLKEGIKKKAIAAAKRHNAKSAANNKRNKR